MTAVVDYGVGNLFSLTGSLRSLGEECIVTSDKDILLGAERIILPGVGAFRDAKQKLEDSGLIPVLDEIAGSGKPLLGICLGMQLLFEKSHEFGECGGLGYLDGEVCPLLGDIPSELQIPHIGWNRLIFNKRNDPLMRYINEGDYVYYVHSYYAKYCEDSLIAYSEYGAEVPGYVHSGNIYGTQFHPEKSGNVGLSILKAFCEL